MEIIGIEFGKIYSIERIIRRGMIERGVRFVCVYRAMLCYNTLILHWGDFLVAPLI